MKKIVMILGAGPAGLFAAKAAEDAGMEPVIVSKKRKSELFGAQYLHRPIPGVSEEVGFNVKYELNGTVQGYKDKVYGPGYRGEVSPEELLGDHQGWDIRTAYDVLWRKYGFRIIDTEFNSPAEVVGLVNGSRANHVVSTIPAPLLCSDPTHGFQATAVWSMGDAPERGLFVPLASVEENTVLCSGSTEDSWYRKSNILGYNTVEWPSAKKPPLEGISEVLKPVATNCTCLPEVHRQGRYGKWTKGVLSDSAYYETLEGLSQ